VQSVEVHLSTTRWNPVGPVVVALVVVGVRAVIGPGVFVLVDVGVVAEREVAVEVTEVSAVLVGTYPEYGQKAMGIIVPSQTVIAAR
jgi:hypothetical protein